METNQRSAGSPASYPRAPRRRWTGRSGKARRPRMHCSADTRDSRRRYRAAGGGAWRGAGHAGAGATQSWPCEPPPPRSHDPETPPSCRAPASPWSGGGACPSDCESPPRHSSCAGETAIGLWGAQPSQSRTEHRAQPITKPSADGSTLLTPSEPGVGFIEILTQTQPQVLQQTSRTEALSSSLLNSSKESLFKHEI